MPATHEIADLVKVRPAELLRSVPRPAPDAQKGEINGQKPSGTKNYAP
jgi:hypothetical protein